MTRVTEKVLNIRDAVNELAAPKNHEHPQYLKNTSSVTYLTDSHSSVEATNSRLGHVIVDTEVKNSNHVVTNAAIKSYVDAIPRITLDSAVTKNSNNGVTSNGVYVAINEAKMSVDGKSPIVPSTTTFNKFDNINTSSAYKVTTNIPMTGKPNINTTNGIITTYKFDNTNLLQILNLPDGSEYRRNNDGTWGEWRLSYMPFHKYTAPLAGADRNNNVHDIEIFQDTNGYTIRWDQTYNPDGSAQTYFLSDATQYAYKYVVKFSKNLDIAGPYVFSNLVNSADIKIQADGIYLRSTKASAKINGINETYFVPRVP